MSVDDAADILSAALGAPSLPPLRADAGDDEVQDLVDEAIARIIPLLPSEESDDMGDDDPRVLSDKWDEISAAVLSPR